MPKGKKGDVAVESICARFKESADPGAEEDVKAFLDIELMADYARVFTGIALQERMAAWRALDRLKKAQKGVVKEVKEPAEPTVLRPKEMFKEDEYSNFDALGIPTADAAGNPIPKKVLSKMTKDFTICKKVWDKYTEERKKYEDYLLYKCRRETMEVDAEIEYPEEIQKLRPISEKSKRPMKVIIKKLPTDHVRAVWTNDIKQVVPAGVDPKCRKHRELVKKFKGLDDRCFLTVQSQLIAKLLEMSTGDASIWEGVKPMKKPKVKEPKPPKEPKGLTDPTLLFQEGQDAEKYSEFRLDGIPVKKANGAELTEKELAPLRKAHGAAKATWDKYKMAYAKYEDDRKSWEAANEADDGGISAYQKRMVCKAAGQQIVQETVYTLIMARAAILCSEVNLGEKDPPDLREFVVVEEYVEEEIITDPVLKALRRFDEMHTNKVPPSIFRELFDAMGEDELGVGTHVLYSELDNTDLDLAKNSIMDLGMQDADGDVTYEDLKAFIEAQDVDVAVGRAPSNLVTCLMTSKMTGWLDECEVTKVYSPRAWRFKLEVTAEATRSKKKDKDKEEAEEDEDEESPKSPRSPKEKDDKKDKKDKKEKKEKKEEVEVKKERSEKKEKKEKEEKKEKKEKEEKKEKKEKEEKKEKKEKKDKKEK